MSNHYTYRAEWSPEDDEYVGLVSEFPSLSWLAPTAGEAIDGISRLVDEVVADMTATPGEVVPVPLTERRYSGKIAFRTSPEQHRQLTMEAAEQGVSVNQWIVQKLAHEAGVRAAASAGAGAAFARASNAALSRAGEQATQFILLCQDGARLAAEGLADGGVSDWPGLISVIFAADGSPVELGKVLPGKAVIGKKA